MSYKRKIPDAVIRRLPRYYRYLRDLKNMGISRVSSMDLSKRTGLTSSQVRQDFYCFGGFGVQGYGYDVEYLFNEIKAILGLDTPFTMVIVGAGHLGQALCKFMLSGGNGFKVISLFDNNPDLVGTKVEEVEIMHIRQMKEYVQENAVDIACLTVPARNAREVADHLVACGVKGIWNFAPVELNLPPGVIQENIHLIDSLMVLGYKLQAEKKKTHKEK